MVQDIACCPSNGHIAQKVSAFQPDETPRARSQRYNRTIKDCGADYRKALEFLSMMKADGCGGADVYGYNATITSCSKAGAWETAVALLGEMQRSGVAPNAVSFNAAIGACKQGEHFEMAMRILSDMQRANVEPDLITFSVAISTCEKSGQWKMVHNLLSVMHDRGVEPNESVWNSAICACGKTGELQRALDMLEQMQLEGFQPNMTSFRMGIEACVELGKFERACNILHQMDTLSNVDPDVGCYEGAIQACERAGKVERVLELVIEMQKHGLKPRVTALEAAISAAEKSGRNMPTDMDNRSNGASGASFTGITGRQVSLAASKADKKNRSSQIVLKTFKELGHVAAECDDGDSERNSPTHAALGLSTTPTSSVAASEAKKKKKKKKKKGAKLPSSVVNAEESMAASYTRSHAAMTIPLAVAVAVVCLSTGWPTSAMASYWVSFWKRALFGVLVGAG